MAEAEDISYDWHIILTRCHNQVGYSANDAEESQTIPVSKPSDNGRSSYEQPITLPWIIAVYRLESDLFDDGTDNDADSKFLLPLDYAKRLVKESTAADGINYDDDDFEGFESTEQAISSPYGVIHLLSNTNHILVDTIGIRNVPNIAKDYVAKAIEVLGEKKFKGVAKGDDPGDFMARMHEWNEEDWKAAVGQRPKNITLHVPLPTYLISDGELDEFSRQIHLAFPHAKVSTNRDLKDDTSKPVERLLWACDLERQMELRFQFRGGENPESHSSLNGDSGYGIDQFFRFGTPLKDVPQKPATFKGAYYYASMLLASRPWSVFAPFEILKVTITNDDSDEIVRWVMFTGRGGGDGGEKKDSLFGSMNIQPELSDITNHFGRQEMYLRSGMFGSHHYPDRLYVAADPIGHVHYDLIWFLKRLFGNSISPLTSNRFSGRKRIKDGEKILDYGVIPSIEVQAGPPDHYLTDNSLGRSFSRRPLTEDELKIVSKVSYYCHKFVEERKLLGESLEPSTGFERTYPDAFRPYGGSDSVKVEYNLDDKFDGIWNAQQKWMWFD